MNQAYRDMLSARAISAVGAARALGAVNHAGLRGQLREIVAREFLTPLLPPTLGIGRGQVVSSYGEHSLEQDIIIYSRSLVPSLTLDGTAGLFPLEAVLYTIEVKSTLNATELKATHESACKIQTLHHRPGEGPPEHIIPCLLAFETDLSQGGKSELERYAELLNGAQPSIRAICVAGRGYWFWSNDWNPYPQTYPQAEMLGLVVGILDTYERVIATRTRPSLREYLQ